jgi:hypothetical protein
MCHIGHALLHVIVSLSLSLHEVPRRSTGDADQDLIAQDARRIAFLLAGILKQWVFTLHSHSQTNRFRIMVDANKIVKRIVSKDLRFIRRDAEEICRKLCGEFPGAVDLRHVYGHFEMLRDVDLVSDVSSVFGRSAKYRESQPDIVTK